MRTASILAAASLIAMLPSCERRPLAAYAALPAPGQPVPPFALPIVRGDTLSPADLGGAPAVLALWSTRCGASRLALQSIERLREEYTPRGVRVVILADDGDPARLAAVMDSARVGAPVAYAAGALDDLFDRSRAAPERAVYPRAPPTESPPAARFAAARVHAAAVPGRRLTHDFMTCTQCDQRARRATETAIKHHAAMRRNGRRDLRRA